MADVKPGVFSGEVVFNVYDFSHKEIIYSDCCPTHYANGNLIEVHLVREDIDTMTVTVSIPSIQQYETVTLPSYTLSKEVIYD